MVPPPPPPPYGYIISIKTAPNQENTPLEQDNARTIGNKSHDGPKQGSGSFFLLLPFRFEKKKKKKRARFLGWLFGGEPPRPATAGMCRSRTWSVTLKKKAPRTYHAWYVRQSRDMAKYSVYHAWSAIDLTLMHGLGVHSFHRVTCAPGPSE